jgi:hypothetical protein
VETSKVQFSVGKISSAYEMLNPEFLYVIVLLCEFEQWKLPKFNFLAEKFPMRMKCAITISYHQFLGQRVEPNAATSAPRSGLISSRKIKTRAGAAPGGLRKKRADRIYQVGGS